MKRFWIVTISQLSTTCFMHMGSKNVCFEYHKNCMWNENTFISTLYHFNLQKLELWNIPALLLCCHLLDPHNKNCLPVWQYRSYFYDTFLSQYRQVKSLSAPACASCGHSHLHYNSHNHTCTNQITHCWHPSPLRNGTKLEKTEEGVTLVHFNDQNIFFSIWSKYHEITYMWVYGGQTTQRFTSFCNRHKTEFNIL
jgi:hypothetical protein